MNQPLHTPGPWITWNPDRLEAISVGPEKQLPVCKVFASGKSKANAKLIAAAPELFELVRKMELQLEAQALGYTASELWEHTRDELTREAKKIIAQVES